MSEFIYHVLLLLIVASCETYALLACTKVRSRIRETGGMWPFARQRCCPPGGYWYQSKALHLPDLILLTVGLQRCN